MVKQDRNGPPCSLRIAVAALAACAVVTSTFAAPSAPAAQLLSSRRAQELFSSPEQAGEALIAASRANKLGTLERILGPAGRQLVHSGDRVAAENSRVRFVAAYDRSHRVELDGPDKATLVVGTEDWPLPIPLVHEEAGWRFDAQAAQQEILDRRIGRNELNVIEVCREYVQAQREFAFLVAGHGAAPEYAQRIMSRKGRHDGLYWATPVGEKESPLGPLVAQARAAGYAVDPSSAQPQAYHGYFFRTLSRQGSRAPGGAKNYVVNGHMTGGFALVAFPAKYGNSGIMTFIVSQDGIVFERNLGPQTATLARRIEQFDPDAAWHAP